MGSSAWGVSWIGSWGSSWGPLHEVEENKWNFAGGDGESNKDMEFEEHQRKVMLRRQDEEEMILAIVQFVIGED